LIKHRKTPSSLEDTANPSDNAKGMVTMEDQEKTTLFGVLFTLAKPAESKSGFENGRLNDSKAATRARLLRANIDTRLQPHEPDALMIRLRFL
jgi:hypothetical protein